MHRDAHPLAARLWIALALAGTAACGGTDLTSAESALAAAERRVVRADERAIDEAWNVGRFDTRLRYNAADCDCPPWELLMAGRWTRVSAVLGDEADAALLAPAPGERDVTARTTREVVTSDIGWRYRVVEVELPGDPQVREGRSIE